MFSIIAKNLEVVRRRISAISIASGRDAATVQLLAVSKTFSADDIRAAYTAGQKAFGENYMREALDKIAELHLLRGLIEWHFIGPIQSNKTRAIAEQFDWVHSIDRLKIARRLSEQRPTHLPPLNVCIQVNISGEASKGGVAPSDIAALVCDVALLPRLRVRGLMSIPEPIFGLHIQCTPHRRLRELFNAINAQGLNLDTLSMGMSTDFSAAILEGATIIRVGTAIFGTRTYLAH
ncbi:YggS family pyridoxal phosphate-dependent enzyme [Candidatus Vallotia lariciata]|uniref:YggS family pyridoxal phosphate-dependent enzyme n=1 Tax=Candidatus Vallotia laricis TaxID=2018052 RepID=UPI001D029F8E|nr:YggS family pyridoxal phosphate-dependent enzyme [Candidatus Vallotia lariciata]UDG82840.1 Pyridoxal phosphate homeostasis protein [Candidatus Vallotia lariciata]